MSRCVAIVGPTASGKSELALQVAETWRGEIISCDSVAVYRGLDIGSGKPSRADRDRVPHHLIDVRDVREEWSAADFAQETARTIAQIEARGRLPVLCGGTGLYLTALVRGLFDGGGRDAVLRERFEALIQRFGAPRLHRLLAHVDAAYAARTKPQDAVRIARALEAFWMAGETLTSLQQKRSPSWRGDLKLVGLEVPRDVLRQRVEARVTRMLASGLVAETRTVLSSLPSGRRPRALASIGYREAIQVLDGTLEIAQLPRAMVTATMQYAKRQMTYFRHQFQVEWHKDPKTALASIGDWVSRSGGDEGSVGTYDRSGVE